MTPLNPDELPAMCRPGQAPNWFIVFDELRKQWIARNPGKNYTNLAERLGIPKQRVTQYATGSGDSGPPPVYVLMQLCHELGFVLVLAPEGARLFKAPREADIAADELPPAAVPTPASAPAGDPARDARVRAAARAQYEDTNEDNVAIHGDAPVRYAAGDAADGKGNGWVEAYVRVDLDVLEGGAEAPTGGTT